MTAHSVPLQWAEAIAARAATLREQGVEAERAWCEAAGVRYVRRSKPHQGEIVIGPMTAAILAVLSDEPMSVAEIVAAMDYHADKRNLHEALQRARKNGLCRQAGHRLGRGTPETLWVAA